MSACLGYECFPWIDEDAVHVYLYQDNTDPTNIILKFQQSYRNGNIAYAVRQHVNRFHLSWNEWLEYLPGDTSDWQYILEAGDPDRRFLWKLWYQAHFPHKPIPGY